MQKHQSWGRKIWHKWNHYLIIKSSWLLYNKKLPSKVTKQFKSELVVLKRLDYKDDVECTTEKLYLKEGDKETWLIPLHETFNPLAIVTKWDIFKEEINENKKILSKIRLNIYESSIHAFWPSTYRDTSHKKELGFFLFF